MKRGILIAAAIGGAFLIWQVVRRQQAIKAGLISPGITSPIGLDSPSLAQYAVKHTGLISKADIPAADLLWAAKRAKAAALEALKRGEIQKEGIPAVIKQLEMAFLREKYPSLV